MDTMKSIYISKWLYLVAIVLVIIGGLNWGIVGGFGVNLIDKIGLPRLSKTVYIIVGLATLYILMDRNTYLPFLGDTVYPCSSLADKVPDKATISHMVKVPPNSKIVYWASEHSDKMDVMPDPWSAYMNYENTGVVTADATGKAMLRIRAPSAYKTPMGKTVDKHIHYRYCKVPGMLSQVYTIFL
jgi:uncharacterized membrane protein YuzA (DUF378 family)